MQIIRDWKLIKETVDQNFEYSFIGFTRSNLFNPTHQYFYDETIKTLNSNRKLFGSLWDNMHDIQVFNGKDVPASTCLDESIILQWFNERNFDYVFIPDVTFMSEFMKEKKYPLLMNQVQGIIDFEKYNDLIPNFYKDSAIKLTKMILARHYFLFSDKIQPKVLNKTCQLFSADGTFSYIYRHFMENYCGGTYTMLPVIRNVEGLPLDILVDQIYPQDVKNLFIDLVPFFTQFRIDHNIATLKSSVIDYINKPRQNRFKFIGLDSYCNEITLNKWVLQLQVGVIFEKNKIYRLWEYDN
jgi:hypothetical protein